MDWNLLIGAASAFASAVSAVTAIIVVKQSQRERQGWRNQLRETKQAEIAGEVTVAALNFLSALESTIGLVFVSPTPKPGEVVPASDDPRASARRNTDSRWEAIAPLSDGFIGAWQRAEVYLDDPANDLLERIWHLRSDIMTEQHMFYLMPLDEAGEYHPRGWGRIPREKIEALRTEVRAKLRPLAHMMTTESSGAENAAKQIEAEKQKQIEAEKQKQIEATKAEPKK